MVELHMDRFDPWVGLASFYKHRRVRFSYCKIYFWVIWLNTARRSGWVKICIINDGLGRVRSAPVRLGLVRSSFVWVMSDQIRKIGPIL